MLHADLSYRVLLIDNRGSSIKIVRLRFNLQRYSCTIQHFVTIRIVSEGCSFFRKFKILLYLPGTLLLHSRHIGSFRIILVISAQLSSCQEQTYAVIIREAGDNTSAHRLDASNHRINTQIIDRFSDI